MDNMTLSPYFVDSEPISQLRGFFSLDEMWTIDFENIISQAVRKGDYFELRLMGRLFRIDYYTGGVTEVGSG